MRDKNFLKDFGASLRDFFGGRTDSYEKAMLEGRETAQREMRERAEKLGANAIVGVSFGYETMGHDYDLYQRHSRCD